MQEIDYEKTKCYFKIKYIDDNEIVEGTINIDSNSIKNDAIISKMIIDSDINSILKTDEKCILLYKDVIPVYKEAKNKINNNYNRKTSPYFSKKNKNDYIQHFYKYYSIERNIEGSISNKLIDAFKRNYINYRELEHFSGIDYFSNEFTDRFIKKYNFFCKEYMLCIVPGHLSSNYNNGCLYELADLLIKKESFTDGTQVLLRKMTIKAHYEEGNVRNEVVHLNSIIINPKISVKDKKILLIDDITTTGFTLNTCKKILLNAGAKKVICFAFGKTSN